MILLILMKQNLANFRVVTCVTTKSEVTVFQGTKAECLKYVKDKGTNASFYKIRKAN